MKATFFKSPWEFQLQVNGESWKQGDPVSGTLVAKAHGASTPAGSRLHVHLAISTFRKIKAKSVNAFEVISSADFPAESGSFDWKFETPVNFPITDSAGSPFLVYGAGEDLAQMGNLQAGFVPHTVISEFISVLQTEFRFVLKTLKWNKSSVEAKFSPPSAQSFALLDHLLIDFHFEGSDLTAGYEFVVKKIEAGPGSFVVQKAEKTTEQTISRSEFLLPSGRIHHPAFEAKIREALLVISSAPK